MGYCLFGTQESIVTFNTLNDLLEIDVTTLITGTPFYVVGQGIFQYWKQSQDIPVELTAPNFFVYPCLGAGGGYGFTYYPYAAIVKDNGELDLSNVLFFNGNIINIEAAGTINFASTNPVPLNTLPNVLPGDVPFYVTSSSASVMGANIIPAKIEIDNASAQITFSGQLTGSALNYKVLFFPSSQNY